MVEQLLQNGAQQVACALRMHAAYCHAQQVHVESMQAMVPACSPLPTAVKRLLSCLLTAQCCCCVCMPAVTPMLGRLFAAWTSVTCVLCLACARDPTNRSIYGKLIKVE